METYKKLLVDTIEILMNEGYSDFTIAKLAEKAQLAKGTIYHHFKSKEELILLAINYYFQDLIKNLEEAYQNLEPLEFFHKMIDETLVLQGENQEILVVLFEILLHYPKQKIHEFTEKAMLPYYKFLGKIFKDLNLSRPWAKAQMFVAILDGIGLQLILYSKLKSSKLLEQSDFVVPQNIKEEIINLFGLNQIIPSEK